MDSSVNFPLHKGDFYTYRLVSVGVSWKNINKYNIFSDDTSYFQAKVIDTISKSGKKYFICKNFPLVGIIYNCYLRNDSLHKCLLMYDSTSSTCNYEIKFYYLGMNPDTSGYCPLNFSQSITFGTVTYFGMQTIYKSYYSSFQGSPMTKYFINYIAKNFGTYYMHYNELWLSGMHGVQYDKYYYLLGAKINGIVYGDTTLPITEVINIYSGKTNKFELFQNYPNPFNPATKIKYQIEKNSFVSIKVYDILGREIENLVNERQNAGTYEVSFDGSNLPSGIYFYRLQVENSDNSKQVYTETKKMISLK
jgi:hypothetical protein